jgi:hypothetical protein
MIDPLAKLREHQGKGCAICRQERTLVVDHDHATGLIRGLICAHCNVSEGAGLDQPWMVEYRANPPAARIGLVVKYGSHRPRPEPGERRPYSKTLARFIDRGLPPCPPDCTPKDWQDAYDVTVHALMEFERDVLRERAAEGRAAAKAQGKTGGRPPSLTPERVAEARTLVADGATADQAAAAIGVSRSTLYRFREEWRP